MAWTAPATYSVSEIVTASKLNIHIRDNLIYLKASPTFDGGIMVGTATGAATGQIKAKGYTGFEALSAESAATGGTFLELNNTSAGGRNFWFGSTGSASGAGGGKLAFYDSTASLFRGAMDSAGNFGFGTTAPQGRVHAVGAGGGFMYLSANAVTSLQTLAIAGTVLSGAVVYVIDRNNTGGATVLGTTGVVMTLGSGGVTYVNNDTMKVDLTAGGAITIARTVGTNGSHQVNMFLLYY